MKIGRSLVFCALTLVPAVALAEQGNEAALCFTLGREVSELRSEVRELKGMIQQLLQQQQQPPPPPAPGGPITAPPPPPPPAPPQPGEKPGDRTGTLTGKLTLPPGDTEGWVFEGALTEAPVKGKSAEIVQLDKRFVPAWLVVQRGTKVSFPNQDPVYHNVFSASAGNQFDLGMKRSGDVTASHVFESPGLIELFCNIHPEMHATILVAPNRHFVKAGPDGRYTLAGLPPGARKIVAWSPSAEAATESVTLQPGQNQHDFVLKPRKVKRPDRAKPPAEPY